MSVSTAGMASLRRTPDRVTARRRFDRLPWWGQCATLWVAVVALQSLMGLVGARVLDLREGYNPMIGVPPGAIPGIWARWDSAYYLGLATEGYAAMLHAAGFFPAFPLLIASVVTVTGLKPVVAGMLVAQVHYLAATLLFYRLGHAIWGTHAHAMRGVLYLLLFPTSFFFAGVYAEPVALAFSVGGAVLLLRERPRLVSAGLTFGLASIARPTAWPTNVLLLTEFLRRRRFSRSSLAALALALLLSGLGVTIFVLYLYGLTGSLLAIPTATGRWLRHWNWPWITLAHGVGIAIGGTGVPGDWFLYVMNWVDLLFALVTIGLTAVAIRWSWQGRFAWSLSAYQVTSLLFLLSSHGVDVQPLWGTARWVAALFPIYLVLGGLPLRASTHAALMASSGAIMCLFMAWWSSGRWVG